MNNTVKMTFGFPNLKWLQYADEWAIDVKFSGDLTHQKS